MKNDFLRIYIKTGIVLVALVLFDGLFAENKGPLCR